nr:peptidyl-prolyl cis-trans isomerase FKBP20-2, chloroplastic [Ipomoea batatas]
MAARLRCRNFSGIPCGAVRWFWILSIGMSRRVSEKIGERGVQGVGSGGMGREVIGLKIIRNRTMFDAATAASLGILDISCSAIERSFRPRKGLKVCVLYIAQHLIKVPPLFPIAITKRHYEIGLMDHTPTSLLRIAEVILKGLDTFWLNQGGLKQFMLKTWDSLPVEPCKMWQEGSSQKLQSPMECFIGEGGISINRIWLRWLKSFGHLNLQMVLCMVVKGFWYVITEVLAGAIWAKPLQLMTAVAWNCFSGWCDGAGNAERKSAELKEYKNRQPCLGQIWPAHESNNNNASVGTRSGSSRSTCYSYAFALPDRCKKAAGALWKLVFDDRQREKQLQQLGGVEAFETFDFFFALSGALAKSVQNASPSPSGEELNRFIAMLFCNSIAQLDKKGGKYHHYSVARVEAEECPLETLLVVLWNLSFQFRMDEVDSRKCSLGMAMCPVPLGTPSPSGRGRVFTSQVFATLTVSNSLTLCESASSTVLAVYSHRSLLPSQPQRPAAPAATAPPQTTLAPPSTTSRRIAVHGSRLPPTTGNPAPPSAPQSIPPMKRSGGRPLDSLRHSPDLNRGWGIPRPRQNSPRGRGRGIFPLPAGIELFRFVRHPNLTGGDYAVVAILMTHYELTEQNKTVLHSEENLRRRFLLLFLLTSGISPAFPCFGKTKSKNPYDERRLLQQNKRIQKENNAPDDFPNFIREGFSVKVVASENYVTRDSGLILWDIAVGKGDCPKAGQQVTFHYIGYNESGRRIDSTYLQGSPAKVRMGTNALIPGFEEGLKDMKPGGRRRIIVPPELGPPVGPSTFFSSKQFEVFDVELLSVQDCTRRTIGFYSDVVCN